MFVKLERAIEVVLDLARENVVGEGDAADNDMVQAREEQVSSIEIVEDFFTNFWLRQGGG